MEKSLKVKAKPQKVLAVELFALQPSITLEQVANKIGVSKKTIENWRSDPNFLDACYDRYMIEFGSQLPSVLNAMVREAQAGNVQAGRLVLEHSGKLVKNINITVDSPFEKFLKSVPDAEVVADAEIVEAAEDISFESLPERNTENQNQRVKNEKVLNRKAIEKEEKRLKYNIQQKEWYKWRKRAEAVDVEQLKGRRPTPAQRKDWQEKIIAAELANTK
tara:strand:+ start:221 stop:877 length:657 start_codon:yes stop_codon:yes gene_type:complete